MRRKVRIISDRRLALLAMLAGASPLALAAPPLALQSHAFAPQAQIALDQVYDESGCHGGNISPMLTWDHPPTGTRSFAVLMFDQDAPGGGWWHWAVFDIPAGVTGLQTGAGTPARHLLPPGAIQVRNDWGSLGYGGPCPPPGPPHHYRLVLYALRTARLGLDASASPAQVAAKVRADALTAAQIIGLYGR